MPDHPEPSIWKRLGFRILDWIYPQTCAVCGVGLTQGRALCDDCGVDLPRLAEPFCGICGEMFQGRIDVPFACPNCQDLKFSFAFARPALAHDERTLDLIHRLKYGRQIHLVRELGHLASEAFADSRLAPALEGKWPLVPVPLHRSRQRHRHFNQSSEISRILASRTGLPVLNALRRIRRTDTQTQLSRKQRLANLHGAFVITSQGQRRIESAPGGVVLVDDVLTTGSTVNECAKVLRSAGFREVVVVTVMRG